MPHAFSCWLHGWKAQNWDSLVALSPAFLRIDLQQAGKAGAVACCTQNSTEPLYPYSGVAGSFDTFFSWKLYSGNDSDLNKTSTFLSHVNAACA